PKWRRVWINITEGMAFEQLTATLANSLDIPTAAVPDGDRTKELGQALLSRLESLEFAAVVFDDSQNLLGTNGEFRAPDLQAFLQSLIDRPTRRTFKAFMLSNASLPFPKSGTSGTMYWQLRGLHPTDARNLLDYWLRLQA